MRPTYVCNIKGFWMYLLKVDGSIFSQYTRRELKGRIDKKGNRYVILYNGKRRARKYINKLLSTHF